MNVVDSSGWIEFFLDGQNAAFFSEPLSDPGDLLVPVITVYEVYRFLSLNLGDEIAQQATAHMGIGTVLDLDARGAIAAAELSVEANLAMADAVVLSEAKRAGATLWTQDADFEGMDGVRYVTTKQQHGSRI